MSSSTGSDAEVRDGNRRLRAWEPVSMRRLGTFGDALVGGSMTPGSADTGKPGDKGKG